MSTSTGQQIVDAAASALLDLLERMAQNERGSREPQKWDEEYAAHAINDCIDRLFCAPEAGMPKPSDVLRDRYHEVYDIAAPFLREDVPLPGSLEERTVEIAERLYSERWPERDVGLGGLRHDDPIRVAIEAEAARDARKERGE